ncbi:NRDE family protein [Acinetobacter sp. WZC-1]|uniref:NRDE family protein n=1 Tax=Acinetobacter sp. WZC-1 TaxID=3459034 RepID=UPI00403DE37F
MCIVALAWQVFEGMPVCLLSNRDEFYHRPASQLHRWPDSPIIAGQDLQSGGTWMGVTAQGRWALVTNFRNATDRQKYPTSRGDLIRTFLESEQTPIRFARELETRQCDYAGFNLFVGNMEQLVYMSNRGQSPQVLPKGVFVVSNGLMSDHWEQTQHLRQRFTQEFIPLISLPHVSESDLTHTAWDLLEDQRKIIPELLPQTGVSPEMEELLSSTFIQSPLYGTRCSNLLMVRDSQIQWTEKTQQGEHSGEQVMEIIQRESS